ncbi:MAG: CUB domain-containing protein, partial [Bacteroidota bacterium]
MNTRKYLLFLLTVCLCSVVNLQAQVEYFMSNQTVNECEGILFDSNLGENGEDYDHNENLTFSICINGNTPITLDFLNFCTEDELDYLRLFDGPDTTATQIGMTYSGEEEPPRAVASSGCLTINFISDANISCGGWEARWFAESSIPVPPEILPFEAVPCESNTVIVTFSESLICDSLLAENFEIRGPQLPAVVSTRPINCTGGRTNQVELTLDPAISRSGNYSVTYTYRVYNECRRLFTFYPQANFIVNNCPISVVLEPDSEELCAGSCTYLFADASGGDSRSYSYTWAPAAPDSAYAQICPSVTTSYFVTVTDAVGATAETSITITPIAAPVIEGGDRSICQSVEPFVLTATTDGGVWSGMGIEEEEEETGLYQPDFVTAPVDSVFYIDENGCEAAIAIEVTPLYDGNDDASCPGAADFQVSGGQPPGGVWSGEHISPEGLFSPVERGSFPVTYTHPNGCAGTKLINVDSISMPVLDSICQSEAAFDLPVIPFGGVWFGDGIEDADEGIFAPEDAAAGSNLLYYEINGCRDSMSVDFRAIRGGRDISACPEQTAFVLPGNWGPDGGSWSGLGIIDETTGLYNPALVPEGESDTLRFETNTCVDTRIVYVRQTEIGDKDTLNFCLDDDAFRLDHQSVEIEPRDGFWRGAGIVRNTEEEYFFNPGLAGEGMHTLLYEANTCQDSFV